MRHRVAHRKLGRVTEHRIALLRNQVTALIRHERIQTTVSKAKELRPFVERLITVAKRGIAEGAESGRALHARRLVARDLTDSDIAKKLFDSIAPRFSSRPGGYTRILRMGRRQGDGAEIAQIELVGSEYTPKVEISEPEAQDTTSTVKSGGIGGRIRRAARLMRGEKKSSESERTKTTKSNKGIAKSSSPMKRFRKKKADD